MRVAAIATAGLWLAACAGPYADDGNRRESFAGPSRDAGHDQPRSGANRQNPYAFQDQSGSSYDFWGAAFHARYGRAD